jgi:poly(3-hydroxybutyrate) depolymerase
MSLPRSLTSLALLSLVAAQAFSQTSAPITLPAYGADPLQTSVSGLSSGAFMAVQMQVAYSGSIVGAGVVAGGPYYCAANNVFYAISICMGKGMIPIDPSLLVSTARFFANQGLIDPLKNMDQRRIYVFSGTADTVVRQPAVDATVEFFKEVGVKPAQLQYVNTLPAGHAVITPSYGNNCAANAPSYISHCNLDSKGYDQAGELLKQIYGPLQPRVDTPAGQMVSFNQRTYANAATSMADTGYLYVPQSCNAAGANCKVHVAIHGCKQSVESVGKKFITDTGYNNWADNNKLMVLYPQVNKSSYLPSNPEGCWDWWGYTGSNYAYKSGSQMKAIKAMVDHLTQQPKASM